MKTLAALTVLALAPYTALAPGIALVGANLHEVNRTCLIDPVTGRPYLVVCNKAKQQPPPQLGGQGQERRPADSDS